MCRGGCRQHWKEEGCSGHAPLESTSSLWSGRRRYPGQGGHMTFGMTAAYRHEACLLEPGSRTAPRGLLTPLSSARLASPFFSLDGTSRRWSFRAHLQLLWLTKSPRSLLCPCQGQRMCAVLFDISSGPTLFGPFFWLGVLAIFFECFQELRHLSHKPSCGRSTHCRALQESCPKCGTKSTAQRKALHA